MDVGDLHEYCGRVNIVPEVDAELLWVHRHRLDTQFYEPITDDGCSQRRCCFLVKADDDVAWSLYWKEQAHPELVCRVRVAAFRRCRHLRQCGGPLGGADREREEPAILDESKC